MACDFTVDTVSPGTHIDHAPPHEVHNDSVSFSFSSNDQGARFQYQLDGKQPQGSLAPYQVIAPWPLRRGHTWPSGSRGRPHSGHGGRPASTTSLLW